MKEEWFKLYEEMLGEMEYVHLGEPDLRAEIEGCFTIAQRYMGQVMSRLEEYRFDSLRDEIDFYKTVKPVFKSYIKYYNFRYHAELFKPSGKPAEMKEFWIREQQRLDKFILENKVFFEYYKSGATNRDKLYFLGSGRISEDSDSAYCDDLIAEFMALEKYAHFVQTELSRL